MAKYGSLPFAEQIDFFRQKIPQRSYSWTDVWNEGHDRAFVVAGAAKDDLVLDLKRAVDRAISEGTTLAQFRKDFDALVERHGWTGWTGEGSAAGRAWRTRVIYQTNLRQSYNAGRREQMQAIAERRPFWRYRHSPASENARDQHLAWDGLVLRHDDPWWDTHSPQNGWGCRCYIETLAQRDLERMGRSGPDSAPPINTRQVRVGENGPNPRTVTVPEGIDPGFGYAPGKTPWTRPGAERAIAAGEASAAAWQPLVTSDWRSYQRPERLPLAEPPVALGEPLSSADEVVDALKTQLGGDQAVYEIANTGRALAVDAETLGRHIDPARVEYLPLLEDAIRNPWEAWLSPERHRDSGVEVMRARLIKAYRLDGGDRALIVVAQESGGYLEAWTFIPTSNLRYAGKQRRGMLIHADEGSPGDG